MNDPSGIEIALAQSGPIPLAVHFACGSRETVALVGPSGAGKTTVLRCIAGLYTPASGYVRCRDRVWLDTAQSIALHPQARRAGLVFQSYALFPHLTAAENVMAAMSHHAVGERRDRAVALLQRVHLDGLEHRRPATLSGGEQQRVAIARALARDPDVLLLDEPFSAVDRHTRARMHSVLAEVRSTLAAPMLLVTHDIDDATRLADRLLVIDRGELLQEGAPNAILGAPASARVRSALGLEMN